jgi:glycosyltransferase involved in cell wall biosynthesis
LEAMAAGVPVVATDIPGNRTLITHEEHGLLVPPHRPDALRGAIERMLDEPGLAARLARNAHERVQRDFSLTQMAQRHLDVIEAARRK